MGCRSPPPHGSISEELVEVQNLKPLRPAELESAFRGDPRGFLPTGQLEKRRTGIFGTRNGKARAGVLGGDRAGRVGGRPSRGRRGPTGERTGAQQAGLAPGHAAPGPPWPLGPRFKAGHFR